MSLATVVGTIIQSFIMTYSWLNNNLISPLLVFARGFEFAIIFISAVIFLAISVFVLLRQAKKLPHSYSIEIFDMYGNKTSVDGIRQIFATHDAAESYARMYQDNFGSQYKFKVVGIPKRTSSSTTVNTTTKRHYNNGWLSDRN